MTPKEKAIELVDKMYGDESDYMTDSQAKQCALIAVDEMINVCFWNSTKEFLLEVKQEIKTL